MASNEVVRLGLFASLLVPACAPATTIGMRTDSVLPRVGQVEVVGIGASTYAGGVKAEGVTYLGGGEASFGVTDRMAIGIAGTYADTNTYGLNSELRFRLTKAPHAKVLATVVGGAGGIYSIGDFHRSGNQTILGAHGGIRGSVAVVETVRLTGGVTANVSGFTPLPGIYFPAHVGVTWRQPLSQRVSLITGLEGTAALANANGVIAGGLFFIGFGPRHDAPPLEPSPTSL